MNNVTSSDISLVTTQYTVPWWPIILKMKKHIPIATIRKNNINLKKAITLRGKSDLKVLSSEMDPAEIRCIR
jgi:hypothetical protein